MRALAIAYALFAASPSLNAARLAASAAGPFFNRELQHRELVVGARPAVRVVRRLRERKRFLQAGQGLFGQSARPGGRPERQRGPVAQVLVVRLGGEVVCFTGERRGRRGVARGRFDRAANEERRGQGPGVVRLLRLVGQAIGDSRRPRRYSRSARGPGHRSSTRSVVPPAGRGVRAGQQGDELGERALGKAVQRILELVRPPQQFVVRVRGERAQQGDERDDSRQALTTGGTGGGARPDDGGADGYDHWMAEGLGLPGNAWDGCETAMQLPCRG